MRVNTLRNQLKERETITHILEHIETEALKGKVHVTFNPSTAYPNLQLSLNQVQVRILKDEGFKVKEDSGMSNKLLVSGWM